MWNQIRQQSKIIKVLIALTYGYLTHPSLQWDHIYHQDLKNMETVFPTDIICIATYQNIICYTYNMIGSSNDSCNYSVLPDLSSSPR